MEGADIYQIAKNCRTSVEMIEKYYAVHIKTSLDAAAIKGLKLNQGFPRATDTDFAARFFYGDVATQQALQEGYLARHR